MSSTLIPDFISLSNDLVSSSGTTFNTLSLAVTGDSDMIQTLCPTTTATLTATSLQS
jgi:hypothetical protein